MFVPYITRRRLSRLFIKAAILLVQEWGATISFPVSQPKIALSSLYRTPVKVFFLFTKKRIVSLKSEISCGSVQNSSFFFPLKSAYSLGPPTHHQLSTKGIITLIPVSFAICRTSSRVLKASSLKTPGARTCLIIFLDSPLFRTERTYILATFPPICLIEVKASLISYSVGKRQGFCRVKFRSSSI